MSPAQAVLLILLALCLIACQPADLPDPVDQSIRPAKIHRVTVHPEVEQHRFVGEVEASATIDMSFRVPGSLVALPVLEGQTIAAGALIAAIDDTDYQLALREARVELELAIQDLDRKQRLLRDKGISQSIVDDARAHAQLRQVALEQAQENLQRTSISAPFEAFVARRYTDNHVNVRVGEPVVQLMNLSRLHVIAHVPERLLATATPERVLDMQVSFPFLPERQFPVQFKENRGQSSSVAATFEVTFEMPRPEGLNILPGMTANVSVTLALPGSNAAIQVPASALMTDAEKNYFVWRYDPVSLLVSKAPVEVSTGTDGSISVTRGLADGELIVASGAANLRAGMKVRRLNESGIGS